ncbi:MAG: hypothetical protein QOC94_2117 [Actinoplanes sp.]|jgi:hypothetical protein|nr:hypothetical protein [Actinoplanes sp.]
MPEIGRVYRLNEPDYRYGVGPLAVRVTRVIREALYDNEPWWEVEGMCKNPTYDGPGQERLLYVRAAALDTAKGGQSSCRTSGQGCGSCNRR